MRLLKVYVENFKRFVGEHCLEVDEQLVALVGPNEAGKSSLLTALERLGAQEAPHAGDRTRRSTARCSVGGLYALDEDDREAIATIHGADLVRTASVHRHLGDTSTYWELDKPPSRDLDQRRKCREQLAQLEGDPALDPTQATDEPAWDPALLDQAMEVLASGEETLTEPQIAVLDQVSIRLRSIRYSPFEGAAEEPPADEVAALELRSNLREVAADALAQQSEVERRPTPWDQIVDALTKRLPTTALFKDVDRVLNSHYDLAAVADPATTPPALANLAKVAGLDLRHIQDLVSSGERPHVERLLNEANERIKEQFLLSWRQARVFPYFTLDQTLQVYVSTEGQDFSYPAERSDGLRWFLALYAFLLSRQQTDLILLVDEAETHLHYDAQADLIDALMSQEVASKVIYTTHSIGCLPPDIGRGIRAVVPEEGKESSAIRNTYWWLSPGENEKVGHIPLLFGMGASLLALTVPRFAVIGEGPSDAILLPSIIRRALDLTHLQYRVVPGLSEIRNEHMPRLKSHAGDIVCLVDGDAGGRALAKNLAHNGIPKERVLSLQVIGNDAALEDLVAKRLLVDAVNEEVTNWGGAAVLSEEQIPDFGRWAWFKKEHPEVEKTVNKNRVAGRLADAVRRSKNTSEVIPAHLVDPIRALHTSILAALNVETANSGEGRKR